MFCLFGFSANGIKELFLSFFESAKRSFVDFSIFDAIDIIVLAAILFVTFRFLKSRKAGALILGITIISLLSLAAFSLGLGATYFVLSSIFDVGIIALIIIFQPEIREALEKVGAGSLNSIKTLGDQRQKNKLHVKSIDEVCAAVKDLSATKTGALIVISGTTKIDETIATGININANVNSFLLRNLFFNKAPLHDGAVIIDGSRIAAAGCLLPLTRKTDVDGDLGTRHRAAIGMSESSDAIVIVVSEETGIISVAYDCTLTRNYTEESLRRFLMRKMIRSSSPEADK